MRVMGYGEDGLTLVYFCTQLPQFLVQIGDATQAEACTVYYRASFGRRGEFGEFDAIVVAAEVIYLCESKWNDRHPSEVQQTQLKRAQVRRNTIMHQIVGAFHQQQPQSWADFREQNAAGFEGFALPAGETKLAKNLWSILDQLRNHPCECKDVLLYFYRSPMMDELPLIVRDHLRQELDNYGIVKVRYVPHDLETHFRLPSLWPEDEFGPALEFLHQP